MVTIRNREMIIPQVERRIGVVSDNNSEMRTFSIPRYIANSIDLSALTFKLDLENENGDTNTAHLVKEVLEDRINLTWTIIANDVSVSGTLLASIRATDGSTVKWGSYKGAFYVESGINTPERFSGNLSELESLELAIDGVLSSEADRQSAEDTRKSNEEKRIALAEQMQRATTGVTEGEQARVTAENARRTAETTRINQENSRKSAETTRATAETKRATAENERVNQENNRNTAETKRVETESERVQAETARIAAENERKTLATNMESATGRANTAAQTCEDLVDGIMPVASSEKIGGILSAGDIRVNADGSVTIPSLTTLQNLIDARIEKTMIAHALNSVNANMVLGADQGPQITSLIDAQKVRVDQLNLDLINRITVDKLTPTDALNYVDKNYDITVGVDADLSGFGSVGHGYFYNRKSGIYNLQHFRSLKFNATYERIIGETGGKPWTKLISDTDLDVKFGEISVVDNNLVYGSSGGMSLYKVGKVGILNIDFNVKIEKTMQDYVVIATIPQEFASDRFRIISTMPQRSQGAYPVMIMLSGTNLKIFSHGLHNDTRTCGVLIYTTI